MVCPECKQAGKVLRMPLVTSRMDKVARLHEKCTNRDCPCQHKIEDREERGEF